jgi:16S rRNA C1402 (ribose-2'-O) methylase RsmI
VAIGRELTKQHQEVLRGTLKELAESVDEALRGEVTLALEGTSAAEMESGDPAQLAARAVWELIWDPALKPREKAKQIAARTGLEARAVYERLARRDDERQRRVKCTTHKRRPLRTGRRRRGCWLAAQNVSRKRK